MDFSDNDEEGAKVENDTRSGFGKFLNANFRTVALTLIMHLGLFFVGILVGLKITDIFRSSERNYMTLALLAMAMIITVAGIYWIDKRSSKRLDEIRRSIPKVNE